MRVPAGWGIDPMRISAGYILPEYIEALGGWGRASFSWLL